MTRTRKNIILSIAILAALISTVFAVIFAQRSASFADTAEIVAEIESEYAYGTVFRIPDGKIKYDGNEYDPDQVVFYTPDGIAHSGTEFELDQLGVYNVEYRKTVNLSGKSVNLKASTYFKVVRKRISVSSNSSSIAYGVFESFNNTAGKSGLKITLADGDTFNYHEPVRLEDGLSGFIKFYINQSLKNLSAGLISVRLTDCYDSSVYVDFTINDTYSDYIYYAIAGANGMQPVGLFPANPGTSYAYPVVNLDGTSYVKYTDKYGMHVNGKGNKQYPIEWQYDTQSKRVYCSRQTQTYGTLCTDLSSLLLYKKAFDGFTTGEAYLSIYASDYRTPTVEIEVEEIDGVAGNELLEDYVDTVKPAIRIKADLSSGDSVYVAKGEKVKVFDSEVFEINSTGIVKTTVFFNYGLPIETVVGIKDGEFTASKAGTYTVLYSATDTYGNVGTAHYNVISLSNVQDKTVVLDIESLSNTTVEAGGRVALPAYSVKSLNGKAYCDVEIIYQDGTVFDLADDMTFMPLFPGTYRVVYSYGDIIKDYEYSIEFTAIESQTNIAYLDKVYFEKYFIKDAPYSIEKVYAYTFDGLAPQAHLADFYVRFDDEQDFERADYDQVFMTGSEEVQFKFVYKGEELICDKIPIIDVSYGKRAEYTPGSYFIGDFDYRLTTDGKPKDSNNYFLNYLLFIADQSKVKNGFAKMDYISPISLNNFNFEFRFVSEKTDFSKMNIILTDYYDSDKQVVISYREVNGSLRLDFNGQVEIQQSYGLSDDFAYDNAKIVSYSVNGAKFMESSQSGNSAQIDCGFKTDKCYLSIEFEEITGETAIAIYNLCGQSLYGSLNRDESTPIIDVTVQGGLIEIGSKLLLPIPCVTDVFSPILVKDITLTVRTPSGSVLQSTDGVSLSNVVADREFEILLEEYGSYRISYRARDYAGNEYEKQIIARVEDLIAPQLTLNGVRDGETIQAKLGEKIRLADCAATDNITAVSEIKITKVVLAPNQSAIVINNDTFTATQKGVYTVVYQAYDEVGNYVRVSYKIKVE